MPLSPPRACPCGGRITNGKCDRCKPRREARPNFRQRGYTTEWSKYSENYRILNPLCAECDRNGLVVAAYCVDHIIPHKGNEQLFWDENNHQSLCRACHAVKSAKEK